MSYSQTMNLLPTHSWVGTCFYVIGFISGLSGSLLIFAAAIGLFLKPMPRPYAAGVEILAIVLLVTSLLVAGAYVSELWIAFFSGNRYELYTFVHARGGMTRLVAYYSLSLVATLLPQFFWNPRFRKSMLAVLLITVGASLPQWCERWVIWTSR